MGSASVGYEDRRSCTDTRNASGLERIGSVMAIPLMAIPSSIFGQESDRPGIALQTDEVDRARNLFQVMNCGSCHILNDAQAYGRGLPRRQQTPRS